MSCMVEGDPNAPILVVAMAPGRDEMAADSPLVGASGRLFWSCAERAGFTRADCYMVNTIGEIQEEGSSPSDAQFLKYWDEFDTAIRQSNARVAICLGADAYYRLSGISGGIMDWRGYIVEPFDCGRVLRVGHAVVPYKSSGKGHRKGDPRTIRVKDYLPPVLPPTLKYIFPTIHPSFVMRTGWKATAVLAYDIARAKRGLDGTLDMRDLTYETTVGPIGGSSEPVAIDIETTRTLTGQDFINRIGVSSRAGTWTVPWGKEAKEATAAILEDPLRLVIGHNLAFDLPRLKAAGCEAACKLFDTMYACQTLQPDLPKGLNFVAPLYLDTKRWKHRSSEEPERYNALDAAQTYHLYQILKEELKETGQTEVFESMMRGLPVLMAMTKRGLKLDPARRVAWTSELREQEERLWQQWNAYWPEVSISSNVQLKSLFYTKLGWKVQRGDDGKPSTDEAALKALVEEHDDPSLPILLAWRKVNTLRKTYADVKLLGGDGCVHPSYVSTAKDKDERGKGMAGTGRIQAKDPNIMNVPQSGRRMYVPHNPNNLLVEFDYVQAELRVVATCSGDATLLERLNGPDIHQLHADLWGCTRKEAKNVTYATMYGAGKAKLQKMFAKYGIKKTQKECDVLLNRFYYTYPTVKSWRESVVSTVHAERCVRNPFGRHRYFWNPGKDIPAALDFIPQSTVADIMWMSLPVVSSIAQHYEGALLTIVHDSYLFEFPPHQLAPAISALEKALTRGYAVGSRLLALPVSYRVGRSWGELAGDEAEEHVFVN